MALEFVSIVLNVFCVGENLPRSTLAGNLYGLVVRECVSCRREHSELYCDNKFTGFGGPGVRFVQTRALRGTFWHIIYRVWWLRECVSCRRERSNVHFDPLFTMVFEVLGVIFAQG